MYNFLYLQFFSSRLSDFKYCAPYSKNEKWKNEEKKCSIASKIEFYNNTIICQSGVCAIYVCVVEIAYIDGKNKQKLCVLLNSTLERNKSDYNNFNNLCKLSNAIQ